MPVELSVKPGEPLCATCKLYAYCPVVIKKALACDSYTKDTVVGGQND
jgi:hypothetical protein